MNKLNMLSKLNMLNKLMEDTEPLIGSESEEVSTTAYTRFTRKYALGFKADATLFRDLRMLFINLRAHNIKLGFNAVIQLPVNFIDSKYFEILTFPTITAEDLERAVKSTKFKLTPLEAAVKAGDEEETPPEDEEEMPTDADEEGTDEE